MKVKFPKNTLIELKNLINSGCNPFTHIFQEQTVYMQDITYRPIEESDSSFLFDVYASAQQEELALSGWPKRLQEGFLRQQFEAEKMFFTEQFSQADLRIVLFEGEPIGRLYLDKKVSEIEVLDIALLPEYRNRGIGTELIRDILEEAQECNKAVHIHVRRRNPSVRLYYRLGFYRIADDGNNCLMEWEPSF